MQPNNLDSKQPGEDRPQNIQPVGRMIQPLSSEDDIRKAAETARPEQPAPSQANTSTAPGNVEPTNAYEQSTLVTEPIHRSPQPIQPQFQTASPQPSSQSNKKSKTIPIIVGLIIVAALGVGAYFFLFNSKIAVSDLVQETVQRTTFLRPKQWSPAGSEGSFGDLKGKDGKSSAVMSVKESSQISPLVGASDAMYEQLRTQLVSQTSVAAIEPAFRNTGEACKTDITFKAEPDTKKTKTAIGLVTVIGSCTREDGEFTLKIRTIAGAADGQIRAIAVGARNVDWDKNSKAFQTILDSVGQAKSN
jgi:flagellar basal body-associated protein FliL